MAKGYFMVRAEVPHEAAEAVQALIDRRVIGKAVLTG